ncbi:MAG: helix-turn-helix domain-containing protein [Alphaproteobacteria bacterium]|nr:helix-turn-helix domain-containing protein [Alphaproteobacteria bacterium]
MSEPLLSKQRVAEILGLHPGSLMRLVKQGRFPKPIRIGVTRGPVRWRPSDVDAWINGQAKAA